jgi:hypothetical protein
MRGEIIRLQGSVFDPEENAACGDMSSTLSGIKSLWWLRQVAVHSLQPMKEPFRKAP